MIELHVAKSTDAAFLRREFNDLGEKSSVTRALIKALADGKLVSLGYGVYGRAECDAQSGQPRLAGDFLTAASQAMEKLGIEHRVVEGEQASNKDDPVICIKQRFRRQLSYAGRVLRVES